MNFFQYPYDSYPRPMSRLPRIIEACQKLINKNISQDFEGNDVHDMRFGQMLVNMLRKNGIKDFNEFYNIEDEAFIHMCESYPFSIDDMEKSKR